MFDHEIPLNQESRITIIYGPNGIGKTVLQQLVNGLFKYDFVMLATTPFEQLRIDFVDGQFVIVEKLTAEKKLSIRYNDGTGVDHVPFKPMMFDTEELIEAVKEHFPFLGLVMKEGEPLWIFRDRIDSHEGKELEPKFPFDIGDPFNEAELSSLIGELLADKADIFRWYYGLGPDDLEKLTGKPTGPFGVEPDWFVNIYNRVRTSFIETGRLRSEISGGAFIKNLSHHLRGDAYFIPTPKPNVMYFAKRFRDRLRWAHESAANLDHVDQLVGIQRAFKLFQDIINERVLFKSMSVKDYDFRFVSDNGKEVPLSALSSGEQHQFILYYYLIFSINPDTLLMIDEPNCH